MKELFFVFGICSLSSVIAESLLIGSNDTYTIQVNQETTVKVHSRPSAGLIWEMISDSNSKISIPNEYGKFVIDQSDLSKGYQEFSLNCQNCISGQSYPTYLILKKPWKDSPTEVRKIIFNAK